MNITGQQVRNAVCAIDAQDAANFVNDFCDVKGWGDQYVYRMEDLDLVCEGLCATKILDICNRLNTGADFFVETIYGLEDYEPADRGVELSDDIAEAHNNGEINAVEMFEAATGVNFYDACEEA